MKDVLKLALEALQWSKPHKDAVITHSEAITSIKEALAQDETSLSRAAQRPWVGLTDEERDAITDKVIGFNHCSGWEDDYAKALEAKLKELN